MKNSASILRAGIAAAVLLVPLSRPITAAPVCGPGSHWVDSCPGGTYVFPTLTTVNALLDLNWDGVLETGPVLLQFFGTTTIFLGPGSPHSMPSEIVGIVESGPFGSILRAGDGNGNLANDGPLYSPGVVQETGNPAYADSFFDVFFEIELSPSQRMRNLTPMQVQGCLTQAPPDYGALNGPCAPRYDIRNYPIDLYDSLNPSILRGQLLPLPQGPGVPISHHVPTPEPASFALVGLALLATSVIRRKYS